MAEQKAITMTDNSWGGDKRRLGLGTTHQVPGEVSAEDAEKLVDSGKARWCEAAEPVAATPAEILAAIDKLDKGNPDHFTNDGKPQVKAIEAVLGLRVTAAERDAAWAEVPR